ncbi:MAG: hypothetical protein OEW64_11905 [Gammaproteobacteria bacterium]|nr:hypothetical protein [Gammaproteobacteria bacterium]MDH5304784.1 hypothetical protein [Gammaproteobacteria bacterium]MDH5323062.1 hypothetical protein [Gammaproteobacteria bacterium]
MQFRLSGVSLLFVLAGIAACSADNESANDDGDDMQQADDSPPPGFTMPGASGDVPVISARTYVTGSAMVRVTGMFEVDEEVPLNIPASISDGEMTWLQFGNSGSDAPNALITVSLYEVGVSVARGRPIATAGAENCTGGMDITADSVAGHYSCPDVPAYDPADGRMASVDIEIDFTAGS